MYDLYCAKSSAYQTQKCDPVQIFVPSPKKINLYGERCSIKSALLRLYYWVVTAGTAHLYYIRSENGTIIHTSYVVPKCGKFPFLKECDIEIGPCVTHVDYRGQGFYPYVINKIVTQMADDERTFYMIIHSDNHASIRGVKKAGFVPCGRVKKSTVLKRYQLVERS